MKRNLAFLLASAFIALLTASLYAQEESRVERLEPPFWWIGMEYDSIQLLVNGTALSGCDVKSGSGSIKILGVQKVANPDYLLIDVLIDSRAKPGMYPLKFENADGKKLSYNFELKTRVTGSDRHQGFSSRDAICLLMPDRFANADTNNDTIPEMLEKPDRSNPHGRHGGDIAGISNNLDYISDLGFTAIWINPLLENNTPQYSYHGYGITDFYRVDPRFGDNEEYATLVNSAHEKELKVIMDMVLNHCGTNHWIVQDTPSNDWLNQWDSMTYSNFRGEVMTDMYSSEYDKTRMEKGWFAPSLADLNLENPFVLKYLIQNTIWWIEYSGMDGIRMDTYPYPDKLAMIEWAKTIRKLYPTLTIVGETWLQKTSHTAYWQSGTQNFDGFDSQIPVVTDFPLCYAISQAMNEKEGWTEGLRRLYYVLSEDFLYANPNNLLIFADNHDLNRYYTSIGEDLEKFKMGIAFLLTTRGIPQVYYGTEILMTGDKSKDDGYIRTDFPGGWTGDTINAFTGAGISHQQSEARTYMKTLLEWRMKSDVIHSGKLKQFIPDNNVYVFFRYNENSTVMVILNKNTEAQTLQTDRYIEGLAGFNSARNIISGEVLRVLNPIHVPAMSALILELQRE
jgi:neopullulanase